MRKTNRSGSFLLCLLFMKFAAKSSNTPDPPKENQNPYSVGNKKGPTK